MKEVFGRRGDFERNGGRLKEEWDWFGWKRGIVRFG